MTSPQTWMITGANRGLGRALTLAALDAGHRVVATVRGKDSLPPHEHLHVLPLDVREPDAAHRAVRQAADHGGGLDVLINNAGYGLIGTIEETTPAQARTILETNLLGPLWLSQAAIPIMRHQGNGHLVQISSVGAVGTMATLGLYNSTKWGLEAFSEAMAAEVRQFGIRVSLIEPGALATDWAGNSMRFSTPVPAYDKLRTQLFGTATVPWPASEPAEPGPDADPDAGTPPADAASAILAHIADREDHRLRVLVGDDAPGQVRAALELRWADYARDPRFPTA